MSHVKTNDDTFSTISELSVIGPSQSPDLNIIEGLWDVLKRKVNEKNVSSRDQLLEVALEAFNSISNETIRTLYDNLPQRADSVLKNRGSNSI